MTRLGRDGFTFIETLLAITIYSIMALGLFSAFRSGVQLWQRMEQRMESNQSSRRLFSTFSKDLHNAVIYSDDFPFNGQARQVSFMTRTVSKKDPLNAELALVSYENDPATGAVLRRAAGASEGFDLAAVRPVQWTGSVHNFKLRYGYPVEKSTSLVWESEWMFPKLIPKAIEVEVDGQRHLIWVAWGALKQREQEEAYEE